MKISSVSKKVLASALSAAMVVAFAPTVAFGADAPALTDDQAKALGYTVKAVTVDNGSGTATLKTQYYKDLQEVFELGHKADKLDGINVSVTLMADQIGEFSTMANVAAGSGETPAHTHSAVADQADVIAIDMNGYTIANDGADDEKDGVALTVSGADEVTLSNGTLANTTSDVDGAGVIAADGAGKLTLKNVTVETASKVAAAVSTANTVLENVTAAGKIEGVSSIKGGTYGVIKALDAVTVSGTVSAASILDEDGGSDMVVTVKSGADLTVADAQTKDGKSAMGIDGDVTIDTILTGKTTSVKVTATAAGDTTEDTWAEMKVGDKVAGKTITKGETATPAEQGAAGSDKDIEVTDGKIVKINAAEGVFAKTAKASANATAIAGTLTGVVKGATVVATAKASGTVVANNGSTANALAIGAVAAEAIEDGALTAEAVSADGNATAVDSALTVEGGTVAVSADGKDKANTVAVDGKLTAAAGKYVGSYAADSEFTGGSFSIKPAAANYDAANYVVVDDGELFTVEQAKNFDIKATAKFAAAFGDIATPGDAANSVKNFVENSLQDISAGKATSGISYAEGVKGSDLIDASKAGTLKLNWTETGYNAKKATAEQTAAYEALKAYAAKSLNKIETEDENTVRFYTMTLTTVKNGETVVLGTITDLGTKLDGRNTVDNAVNLPVATASTADKVIAFDGSAVSTLAFDVDEATGKAKNYAANPETDPAIYMVSVRALPTAIAVMSNDDEALKNAVIKEEQTPAPVEKATQGIDVSKKSRTVKLAKGKTKTQKALYFKMGASAETALTTAKKSGSSRITVSGDKVTLKKGTKKGTYTAKVSLKAASSAEYLAAAKTITVKFVVKK